MEHYYFVSHWFVTGPIETVWQALAEIEKYPEWWHEFKKVTLTNPDHQMRIGAHHDWEAKSGLPYTLRYSTELIKMQSPCFLQFHICGDLEGDFRYVLEPRAGGTAVTFYWDNRTPKPIMNFAAKLPFVRGLFTANHTMLMDNGYRGLKARIEGNAN